MSKVFSLILLLFAMATGAVSAAEPADAAADAEAQAQRELVASIVKRHGEVKLGPAKATLNIPERFYFLDAEDAQRVLEKGWGNPPDASVLGMILPEGKSPFDEGVWAATFTYLDDGYVSDADATKTDYDKLLGDMQRATKDENAWRKENGYPPVQLVGWAERPVYLSDQHKMYWAKDLVFGESGQHTLNYDIRVLGRAGVLVVSFIAGMDQLADIKRAAPSVLATASFDAGSRYADYVKGVDKKAAYGLAGLVAGGLIAKKTGLLAAALLFGKKFIALIAAGIASLGAFMRRLFGKKSDDAGGA